MATTMIIVALCGLGIGVLSSLMGIGGGTVIIPLLRLAFGVDGLVASGTSLFVILPTSLVSTIGRIRNGGIIVWLGLSVGLGGVLFSPVGSWLAQQLGGFWPMIVAAVIIVYTSISTIRKAVKLKGNDGNRGAEPHDATQAQADHTMLARTPKRMVQAVIIGVIAGFLSGFVGVGGGFIIVPMSMWLFGLSFKEASGASLLSLCILAIPGIVVHARYGHIEFLDGTLIAAGSIPGAFLGSKLVKHVSEKALRIAFGCMLAVVGVLLAVNEFAI